MDIALFRLEKQSQNYIEISLQASQILHIPSFFHKLYYLQLLFLPITIEFLLYHILVVVIRPSRSFNCYILLIKTHTLLVILDDPICNAPKKYNCDIKKKIYFDQSLDCDFLLDNTHISDLNQLISNITKTFSMRKFNRSRVAKCWFGVHQKSKAVY